MVIHSSFVRNVWICTTPRVTSYPFTYPHVWTLLTSNSLLSMMKGSLAWVILLSLTYPHVTGKSRMNNYQALYFVTWKYNSTRNIIFFVSKIYLIFLIILIYSTNDQNTCVELFQATFTH